MLTIFHSESNGNFFNNENYKKGKNKSDLCTLNDLLEVSTESP